MAAASERADREDHRRDVHPFDGEGLLGAEEASKLLGESCRLHTCRLADWSTITWPTGRSFNLLCHVMHGIHHLTVYPFCLTFPIFFLCLLYLPLSLSIISSFLFTFPLTQSWALNRSHSSSSCHSCPALPCAVLSSIFFSSF
jgi:hypothetical protein